MSERERTVQVRVPVKAASRARIIAALQDRTPADVYGEVMDLYFDNHRAEIAHDIGEVLGMTVIPEPVEQPVKQQGLD